MIQEVSKYTEIMMYRQNYPNFYLYGAGKRGSSLLAKLHNEKVVVDAVIVSNRTGNPNDLLGVPIIPVDDIEVDNQADEIVEEITKISEKEYIVSGMANVSKVFDLFDINDDEIEAQTVNGWAMATLGKIPEVGDSFESDGLAVEILEMDDKRVENLRIIDIREEEDEEDEDKHKKKHDDEEKSDEE